MGVEFRSCFCGCQCCLFPTFPCQVSTSSFIAYKMSLKVVNDVFPYAVKVAKYLCGEMTRIYCVICFHAYNLRSGNLLER